VIGIPHTKSEVSSSSSYGDTDAAMVEMTVASALVSSRLDYANSVLFGCPEAFGSSSTRTAGTH